MNTVGIGECAWCGSPHRHDMTVCRDRYAQMLACGCGWCSDCSQLADTQRWAA